MPQPAAKLSLSVPGELAEELRRTVGARGLSGFVTRAIAHELERQRLGDIRRLAASTRSIRTLSL